MSLWNQWFFQHAKKTVKVTLDDKAEQEISKIPLSNYTLQRSIIDFSDNIEQNIMAKLKHCQFTLQISESTDISNHAQIIAFARVIYEGMIINQFFAAKIYHLLQKVKMFLKFLQLTSKRMAYLGFLHRNIHW